MASSGRGGGQNKPFNVDDKAAIQNFLKHKIKRPVQQQAFTSGSSGSPFKGDEKPFEPALTDVSNVTVSGPEPGQKPELQTSKYATDPFAKPSASHDASMTKGSTDDLTSHSPWNTPKTTAAFQLRETRGERGDQTRSSISESTTPSRSRSVKTLHDSKYRSPAYRQLNTDIDSKQNLPAEFEALRLNRTQLREARKAQLQRGIDYSNTRRSMGAASETVSTEYDGPSEETPTSVADEMAMSYLRDTSQSKTIQKSANEGIKWIESSGSNPFKSQAGDTKKVATSKEEPDFSGLVPKSEDKPQAATAASQDIKQTSASSSKDSMLRDLLANAVKKIKQPAHKADPVKTAAEKAPVPLPEPSVSEGSQHKQVKFNPPQAKPEIAFNSRTAKIFQQVEADPEAKKNLLLASWGQKAQRDMKPAGVRRLTLLNFPPAARARHVAAFVWGGVLESIKYTPGFLSAQVTFVDPVDADKYYQATANGIPWPGDPKRLIEVQKATETEPISGMVSQWVKNGKTRCLRLTGVEEIWGTDALLKLAQKELQNENAVEFITVGPNRREVLEANIRFCSIRDAVKFEGSVNRMEEFEAATKTYQDDPCENATGFHDD